MVIGMATVIGINRPSLLRFWCAVMAERNSHAH
jgi:hypothetical protein